MIHLKYDRLVLTLLILKDTQKTSLCFLIIVYSAFEGTCKILDYFQTHCIQRIKSPLWYIQSGILVLTYCLGTLLSVSHFCAFSAVNNISLCLVYKLLADVLVVLSVAFLSLC